MKKKSGGLWRKTWEGKVSSILTTKWQWKEGKKSRGNWKVLKENNLRIKIHSINNQ